MFKRKVFWGCTSFAIAITIMAVSLYLRADFARIDAYRDSSKIMGNEGASSATQTSWQRAATVGASQATNTLGGPLTPATLERVFFEAPTFGSVLPRAWSSNDPLWFAAALRARQHCQTIPPEPELQVLQAFSGRAELALGDSAERQATILQSVQQCADIRGVQWVDNAAAIEIRKAVLITPLSIAKEAEFARIAAAISAGRYDIAEAVAMAAAAGAAETRFADYPEFERYFASQAAEKLSMCAFADLCGANSAIAREICYKFGACVGNVHQRLAMIHDRAGIALDRSEALASDISSFLRAPNAQTLDAVIRSRK